MKQGIRYRDFLKDVFLLSVTCFGGPQAHLAHFQNVLVQKRNYITEDESLLGKCTHVVEFECAFNFLFCYHVTV